MYPIIQLQDDAFDQTEQLGTKYKFWYHDESGGLCLFKEGRPNTGENWAEKVCCELCELLGIPHAHYEFAMWENCKGVVSPSFVPKDGRLIHGNELLAKIVHDYDYAKHYRARQHTVAVVVGLMRVSGIRMPSGFVPADGLKTAACVFVGYLMLDALVSNQDRHDLNWGWILADDGELTLAPSFDHASSLGRNESDAERVVRLGTKDSGRNVAAYVARARSAFYSNPSSNKPLTTIEAFQEAAKLFPEAKRYWLQKLEATSLADYESIFNNVPPTEISIPAKEFALRMLEINRHRLLQS